MRRPIGGAVYHRIRGSHCIAPAPEREHTTAWREFIRSNLEVLPATDFITLELLTLRGLVTYNVRMRSSGVAAPDSFREPGGTAAMLTTADAHGAWPQ